MKRFYRLLIAFTLSLFPLVAEESFILLNDNTNETLHEIGDVDTPHSPCSTFKIALSLMGFDSEILIDEATPIWEFQEGYDCFLESWKLPQSPRTWLKQSCVWYSRVLASKLGPTTIQHYLSLFNYGNQDSKDGLTTFWLGSTLQISVKEQAAFILRILKKELGISHTAIEITENLLFIDQLPNGEKLFGKTGWDRYPHTEIGWFVGWVQKNNTNFPFAYCNIQPKIDLPKRIPRVKELLIENGIIIAN